MLEVFSDPDHVPLWRDAALGAPPDWQRLLGGYVATVDWPGAAFWEELSEANPDALVLLSTRDSVETWWRSASATIVEAISREPPPEMAEFTEMARTIVRTQVGERWQDPAVAMAAYERHNQHVRATVGADRLVDWQPGDGWAPICAGLGVAVPDEPFPHVNSTAEARMMMGLDADARPEPDAPSPPA
jgi:hypothetical protein